MQHKKGPYKQVTLVRLTHEYARSDASRDNFLRFFFQQTQISYESSESNLLRSYDYGPQLTAFADTLVENFFLPCKITLILKSTLLKLSHLVKASTKKTPQPSLATLSELQSAQSPVGTTQRLVSLKGDCFIRDRHRCVVSRTFDDGEAMRRVVCDGDDEAHDDEGNLLKDESGTFVPLEVAHIIPHSLMNVGSGMLELVFSTYLYAGLNFAGIYQRLKSFIRPSTNPIL